jgi:catechol 2,3-dioxygenase-like lactoylglutathione lyase family enzyme
MASKTKVSLSTLSYVILYVKDTEDSVKFYRDILGMQVDAHHPGWVELNVGTTKIALHNDDGKNRRKSHQSVLVFQVDNIFEAYESLQEAGVKFQSEPEQVCQDDAKVGISADFEDLDGNLLSIFSYVKK